MTFGDCPHGFNSFVDRGSDPFCNIASPIPCNWVIISYHVAPARQGRMTASSINSCYQDLTERRYKPFSAHDVNMQLGRNDFELSNVNRIRSESVTFSGERERLKYSLDKRNFEDIKKHLVDTGTGSFDVSSFPISPFLI